MFHIFKYPFLATYVVFIGVENKQDAIILLDSSDEDEDLPLGVRYSPSRSAGMLTRIKVKCFIIL